MYSWPWQWRHGQKYMTVPPGKRLPDAQRASILELTRRGINENPVRDRGHARLPVHYRSLKRTATVRTRSSSGQSTSTTQDKGKETHGEEDIDDAGLGLAEELPGAGHADDRRSCRGMLAQGAAARRQRPARQQGASIVRQRRQGVRRRGQTEGH